MTHYRLKGIPSDFWELAFAAPHRYLMLDYDGTLAPFRVDREAALPFPAVLSRLQAIAADGGTSIAIVSGRPVSELEVLIGPFPATLVGEHGWERRELTSEFIRQPLCERVAAALERASSAAQEHGLGENLECKRASIVLHTRGFSPSDAENLERKASELWWEMSSVPGLRLTQIHGGLELRASSHDKGTAVRKLLDDSPQGTFPVYLGDDQTDEDAFREVLTSGFGIRIGSSECPSSAQGRLASCSDVTGFLDRWIEHQARSDPAKESTT
jgi:trehalose-phosphatase